MNEGNTGEKEMRNDMSPGTSWTLRDAAQDEVSLAVKAGEAVRVMHVPVPALSITLHRRDPRAALPDGAASRELPFRLIPRPAACINTMTDGASSPTPRS